MAWWARYEVGEPEHRPNIRECDGKQFDREIAVTFFDETDEDCGTRTYYYITPDEVLADIHAGREIDLRHCYVKGLTLGIDIHEAKYVKSIPVNLHHAEDAFFDDGLNFCCAHFENGDVSFRLAQFGDGNVRFINAVFEKGNVRFDRAQFGKGEVSFDEAQFGEGDISFDEILFGEGRVIFWKTQFGEGDVSFDSAQFGDGDVSFRHTQFGEGNVSFKWTKFGEGNVSFKWTKFGEGNVSFIEAQFGEGKVSFDETLFDEGRVIFWKTLFGDGDVSFFRTQFGDGKVSFDSAQFGEGKVSFSFVQFGEGNVSFWNAQFGEGDVDFIEAQFGEGDVNFYRAQFGEGKVSFIGTQFGEGNISFKRAQFGEGDVDFDEAQFGQGKLIFDHVVSDALIFNGVDLTNSVSFMRATVVHLQFINTTLKDDIDLTGTQIGCLEMQHCINHEYISCNWHANNLAPAIEAILDDESGGDSLAERHTRAAETALLLKENFRKLGRYDDEDEAYHCFKRHQLRARHYEKTGLKRWFDFEFAVKYIFFEKLGGYGTRPWNILYTIPGVMGGFALLYHAMLSWCMGKIEGIDNSGWLDWRSALESLYFSAITFLTIGYGDLKPTTGAIRLFVSAEGLIGLLLIAYFTIAFSRKVLR